MKKLKLNLDELKVESFNTSTERKTKGTANGFAASDFGSCNCDTSPEECTWTDDDPGCDNEDLSNEVACSVYAHITCDAPCPWEPSGRRTCDC